jgi:osmotically-inducible protein OsmY
MTELNMATVSAAFLLAFGTGAMAAQDMSKDEPKAAEQKAAQQKVTTPTNKKESPGEYIDDSVITGKVKAAVFEEASLKSAEINVETYKGIVQLTGFVSSRADIDKTVALARTVKGVKSVKNDMVVKGKQ